MALAEFVVNSRFAPRVSLPLEKPTFSNSNPIRMEDSHEKHLGFMCTSIPL